MVSSQFCTALEFLTSCWNWQSEMATDHWSPQLTWPWVHNEWM